MKCKLFAGLVLTGSLLAPLAPLAPVQAASTQTPEAVPEMPVVERASRCGDNYKCHLAYWTSRSGEIERRNNMLRMAGFGAYRRYMILRGSDKAWTSNAGPSAATRASEDPIITTKTTTAESEMTSQSASGACWNVRSNTRASVYWKAAANLEMTTYWCTSNGQITSYSVDSHYSVNWWGSAAGIVIAAQYPIESAYWPYGSNHSRLHTKITLPWKVKACIPIIEWLGACIATIEQGSAWIQHRVTGYGNHIGLDYYKGGWPH